MHNFFCVFTDLLVDQLSFLALLFHLLYLKLLFRNLLLQLLDPLDEPLSLSLPPISILLALQLLVLYLLPHYLGVVFQLLQAIAVPGQYVLRLL